MSEETTTPGSVTPAPLILCGIGGGIAVYKAADLVSRLVKSGAGVQVAMTPAARRFVDPLTFQALTGRPVQCELFPAPAEGEREALYPHLFPASEAQIMLVLPATAGLLARLATGQAGDIVCASALGLGPECLRFICPAMHTHMWAQASVQRNVRRLEADGWRRIGPEEGMLACGTSGPGRMAEPATIAAALQEALQRGRSLAGQRIVILSGPTHEYLDAVRYIGNRSSGRMGCALAEAATARGAEVDFITGPVDEARWPRGPGIHMHPVVGCADMLAAAKACFPKASGAVFAAAVADFAPRERQEGKTPRDSRGLQVTLRATPDIAGTLCAGKRQGQWSVGFALESEQGETRARAKLSSKNLDAIVLNGPEAMGAAEAQYRFLTAAPDELHDWGPLSKETCAARLLDWVTARKRR